MGGDGNDDLYADGRGTIGFDAGDGNDYVHIDHSSGLYTISLGAGYDQVYLGPSGDWAGPVNLYDARLTITDFAPGALGPDTDVLFFRDYLGSVLAGWDGAADPFAGGYLQLRQDGTDAVILIDSDGPSGDGSFREFIRLADVDAGALTAYNLNDLKSLIIAGGAGEEMITGGDGDHRIEGLGGDDALAGGAGDDVLDGGDGNDMLDGGAGADLMAGGLGDDVYFVDGPADTVVELPGQGVDEIRTALASYSLAGLAHVETLSAANSSAHDFEGNGGDNVLTGGGGDDVLRGGAGSNSLLGGEGNDVIRSIDLGVDFVDGGDGNDVAIIDWSAQTLDFFTVAAGDIAFGNFVDTAATLTGVEKIIITTGSGADSITTLGGDDEIRTGSGNDYLNGAGGDDYLDGGAGEDSMVGGTGDDIYVVSSSGDVVSENGGEGTDEVRTSLATYTLGANVENLTGTAATGQILFGNSLNNVIRSGEGADRIRLESGGDDSAFAGAGMDSVFFGAALTTADSADGGADRDQLSIQGDYRTVPLVLGSGVVNFESFLLLSGTDTRFGDDGTHSYSYDITSADETVAAGQQMVVDGAQLQVGEDFTFDGSAETDGAFRLWGGMGLEDLTGGAMSDQFYFSSGRFGADDKVDGGGSRDQLGLRGDYTLEFGADQITSIESLLLLSGRGVVDNTDYDYDLTMDDLNLAGGVLMTVDAGQLTAGEHLTFDGSAETDGSFRIFGGAGADSLIGSANGDIIFGALGKDYLKGGAGADAYSYRSAADSTSTGYDTIDGFEFGIDTLDLPGVHDSYGHTAGSVSTATFDADISAATVGMLGSSALFLDVTGGDLAGKLFLIVDQNGIVGYQAGEDFVIELANTTVPPPPIPDFIV